MTATPIVTGTAPTQQAGIRVLVTGGRKYGDTRGAFYVLDTLHTAHGIRAIVSGRSSGADLIAERWAYAHEVPHEPFPVTDEEWATQGRRAGPMRNARMVATRPDLVVAFPGGRGTADCVRQARRAGISVYEVASA